MSHTMVHDDVVPGRDIWQHLCSNPQKLNVNLRSSAYCYNFKVLWM